ncbi:hypothetical protein ACOSP7_014906 [Xanthoceras sorbifolium]
MSSFGYRYRDSNTNNGLGPQTNDWSRTTYDSDHVCRPVIIDAEGRKHPIVSYSPTQNTGAYITETETIVQRVHAPVAEFRYSSAADVIPLKGHGYGEDNWRKPVSPVRDHHRPQHTHSPFDEYNHSSPTKGTTLSPFSEYKHNSPTKVVPMKDHGYGEDKWHTKPLSPVRERPQKVEEFITEVQTVASRPNRFGPLSANVWQQSPNSNKGYQGNTTGYGDYSDLSSKESYKPSGNTIRNDPSHGYYRKNDSTMEPTINTSGGWARPNRSSWASPPNSSLSKPTNDIGTAMEMLKEAARPTSVTTAPHSRFTVPVSTGPTKRDDYDDTIDSKEAARRYANFNRLSRPADTYTTTIDSREAVRRYNGAMM